MANNIFDYFREQSDRSAVSDIASQIQAGQLDPVSAQYALAQKTGDPSYLQNAIALKQQMAVYGALGATPSSQPTQQQPSSPTQPSALASYSGSGDSDPTAPIPQGLPAQSAQVAPQQQQSPLSAYPSMTGQGTTPGTGQQTALPNNYPDIYKRINANPALLHFVPPDIQSKYLEAIMPENIAKARAYEDDGSGGFGLPQAQLNAIQQQGADIAAYRKAPPSSSASSRNPQYAMALQQAIDNSPTPDGMPYDATKYATRQKTANDFSPGGDVGQKLTSIDTAINTGANLLAANDALGGYNGYGSDTVNKLWNDVTGSSNSALKNYTATSIDFGDEVAKALSPGSAGAGEADKQSKEGLVGPNQSPENRKAAIQTQVGNLLAKLDPYSSQYNQAYNAHTTGYDFLSPNGKQNLAKMGLLPSGVDPNAPSALATGPAQSTQTSLSQMASAPATTARPNVSALPAITPAMAHAELARRAAARRGQ